MVVAVRVIMMRVVVVAHGRDARDHAVIVMRMIVVRMVMMRVIMVRVIVIVQMRRRGRGTDGLRLRRSRSDAIKARPLTQTSRSADQRRSARS